MIWSAKMSSADIRITDFQFGSKTQLVCTSLRIVDGSLIPSCDIFEFAPYSAAYEYGLKDDPQDGKLIELQDCSELRHIATFELAPLSSSSRSIVSLWPDRDSRGPRIIGFTLEVSQTVPGPHRRDQIITLRIRGANERGQKHEVQAVILVSGMFRMISEARQELLTDAEARRNYSGCHGPTVIRWARAGAALAVSTSLATAPSVSSGTRTFTIRRASPSKKAVICRVAL
jgi:hypothetical protein